MAASQGGIVRLVWTELKLDNYFFQEQEISLHIAEAADKEGVGIHP